MPIERAGKANNINHKEDWFRVTIHKNKALHLKDPSLHFLGEEKAQVIHSVEPLTTPPTTHTP
jgi:hypothetical protein